MLSNDDSKTYARPSESDVLGEGLGICMIREHKVVEILRLEVPGSRMAKPCLTHS